MILFSSSQFSSHSPPPGHPERMERGGVFEAVAASFRKGGGTVTEPRLATREELARIHTPAYLDSIEALGGRYIGVDYGSLLVLAVLVAVLLLRPNGLFGASAKRRLV